MVIGARRIAVLAHGLQEFFTDVAHGIALDELSTQRASLETAFMELRKGIQL